jgi:hypothetical protein
MRALVGGVAATCLLAGAAIFSSIAFAQKNNDIPWAMVELDGGALIDVPAMVAGQAKPGKGAPKDVMMFFNLSAGAPGTLSCELKRDPYGKDTPRETLAAGLAKGGAGEFCKVNRSGISNWQLGSATAAKPGGLPGGTCLSAFTDASQQAQGRVLTMEMVAGKKNFYQLVCINAFDDKDGAVTAYALRWSPIITRVQKSLHLAADEK